MTAPPYRADPTGTNDSAPAINAALAAAAGAMTCCVTVRAMHVSMNRGALCLAGRTVCFRAGNYAVMQDINLNVNGANVIAASGAVITYKNNMQWFVRGNTNTLNQVQVNCNNSAFSGFVIWGSGNRFTSCSVCSSR